MGVTVPVMGAQPGERDVFRDREDAGRLLAGLLVSHRGRLDVVVLALTRTGVPVAYEVASALDAPLDVLLVRKLGAPGQEGLAMGAIATGGHLVVNDDVLRGLQISPGVVQQVVEREGRELLRHERVYRDGRPPPAIVDRVVLLVDDGLATGASMRAAILAVRAQRPAKLVVAIPTVPGSTYRDLADQADEVVCATTSSAFLAVGQSYWNSTPTTDEEVRRLLRITTPMSPAVGSGGQSRTARDLIRSIAKPLSNGVPQAEALFDLVDDAQFVLIGTASHGTHEFYAARATMTRLLIEQRGFCAVAAEADWQDAYRVNGYVRRRSDDATAEAALRGFEGFPTWMWRNTAVLNFVKWLREYNDAVTGDARAKVGFYGLDLYSLYRSVEEVIAYLDCVDPAAARRAREHYACLDHHDAHDGRAYSFAAAFGAGESCERKMVDHLVDVKRDALDRARSEGLVTEDELFYAAQNARTVRAAEQYYRALLGERDSSWNLRDRKMVETLDALADHLGRQRGRRARIVVWAHNSHLGDARATEVGAGGDLNVGQLVRQRHPGDCRLIGFTTYTGTVRAADGWGGPAMLKQVSPGLSNSIEELFHEVGSESFLVQLGIDPTPIEMLRSPRLERAIGIIYRPETERQSHHLRASVAGQFDAIIHIDDTRAVEPIEQSSRWQEGVLSL